MGHLWRIIQEHLDDYGVRDAAFARRMGTKPQTLNSWKKRGLRQLPERRLLEAVARETRTPYEDVLLAALADIDYLAPDVDLAARRTGGPSEGERLRAAQDQRAEDADGPAGD